MGYIHNGTGNTVSDPGIGIRYDAASNSYVVSRVGVDQGRLEEYAGTTSNSRFISATVRDHSTPVPTSSGDVILYRTGAANPELSLTYSTVLFAPLGTPWDYGGGLFVAFGSATPPGGTPTTGSASYSGQAFGETLSTRFEVRGTVQLNFDFAAGSLSGFFDPLLLDTSGATTALSRETLVNTLFGSGSQTFSGTMAGFAGSSFDGRFTGPAAQEFIGRFQQPVSVPGQAMDSMVGVWVGKR